MLRRLSGCLLAGSALTFTACTRPTPPISAPPTLAPTKTSATATPAPAATDDTGVWLVYTDPALGFSFEYPAVFEEPARQALCGAHERPDGVIIANQIWVVSESALGRTAETLVDEVIARDSLSVQDRSSPEAVDYRVGSLNAFGTLFVRAAGDRLYTVRFEAGTLGCEFAQSEMGRFQALQHLTDTLSLFAPSP